MRNYHLWLIQKVQPGSDGQTFYAHATLSQDIDTLDPEAFWRLICVNAEAMQYDMADENVDIRPDTVRWEFNQDLRHVEDYDEP